MINVATCVQAPIEELAALREPAALNRSRIVLSNGTLKLPMPHGIGRQSEFIASFQLPDPHSASASFSFGVALGGSGPNDDSDELLCLVEWSPSFNATFYEVPVSCGDRAVGPLSGGDRDTLRFAYHERECEIRAYVDFTVAEVFFQKGRVVITKPLATSNVSALSLVLNATAAEMSDSAADALSSDNVTVQKVESAETARGVARVGNITVLRATVFPMKSIWTTAESVRAAPRVYF